MKTCCLFIIMPLRLAHSLTHSPPGGQYDYQVKKITNYEKGKIARAKLRGAKPKVPPEIRNNSTSPIKAILTAMNKCYRNDAKLRPSAKEIANYLQSELDAIELPLKVMDRFEFDV